MKILRGFGCERIGFADDFEKGEVALAFEHHGRAVQLRANAKGWAQLYLKRNPHLNAERALRQGHVAVNSALRDWVKGQVTMIECGILSFEAVFMPYMLTSDGRTVVERLSETKLLPEPASPKVVSLK
jgi:hypothetical protein